MNASKNEHDANEKSRSRVRRKTTQNLQWQNVVLHQLPNILRKILCIATSISTNSWGTIFLLLAVLCGLMFAGSGPSPIPLPPSMQSLGTKSILGYLFVLNPLLSTLTVCLDSSGNNAQERVIAASVILSILCNQLPKIFSAFVGACAMLAFGLASRQLSLEGGQNHNQSNAIETKEGTNANSDTVSDDAIENDKQKPKHLSILQRIWQRIWTRATIKERASIGAIAVVGSLMVENFVIWVVSATYAPGIYGRGNMSEVIPPTVNGKKGKIEFPDALQDNGRLVLEGLIMFMLKGDATYAGKNVNELKRIAKRMLQTLRDGLNVQWALVSGLGAAFICLELKLGRHLLNKHKANNGHPTQHHIDHPSSPYPSHRTLAGLALHGMITMALARIIRTVSFVLTVLPSQVPNCYKRHFPYPPPKWPEEWKEWLLVGFVPNARGGCNDLILSGHATATTTLACASSSVAGNSRYSMALWTLVALDYSIEAYQGLHYSVDMWLGCIVTCLIWQLTKPLEWEGEWERECMEKEMVKRLEHEKENTTGQPPPLDSYTIAKYSLPALLGFLCVGFFPLTVNHFLSLYCIWAGTILVKYGQTNYSQHVLICMLYTGLGGYL